MFFASSTVICTKKKKPSDASTGKSTRKSTVSKMDRSRPLDESGSDTNLGRSRPTDTVTPTSATSVTPGAAKRGKKSAAAGGKKYGKANTATVTAEDEFKFPSLKESVRSEQTDLDELDDEPNPLMDKEVQERLRSRWAKKDKALATQADEPAAKGGKMRGGRKTKKSEKSKKAQGFLPAVPEARHPSVYVK